MNKLIIALTALIVAFNGFNVKGIYNEPYEIAGLSESDFNFISSVVEAESNRSTDPDDLRGRVLIAEVILNRVSSPLFAGDTIPEILTAPGQFSTVVNGRSVVSSTALSDQAVIEAIREIETGAAPNVLFFNCIGYNYGTPYRNPDTADGNYGGNYFMTLEEA